LLVPKLQLGNAAFEAPASGQTIKQSLQYRGSQAGAWEPANTWVPKQKLGNQSKIALPDLATI